MFIIEFFIIIGINFILVIGNKKNICIFLYSLVLFKIVFIFMENIIRGEKGNLLGYYMFLFIKEFFRW